MKLNSTSILDPIRFRWACVGLGRGGKGWAVPKPKTKIINLIVFTLRCVLVFKRVTGAKIRSLY
jgi:hypothetical protein